MNHNRIASRFTKFWLALSLGLIPASFSLAQTFPATAPTTRASTRNNNGVHGITTQPNGLILNFRDASIDAVLDELVVLRDGKPV